MKGMLSNTSVRSWYVARCNEIPSIIDYSHSIEEQASQACELRNKYRTLARDAMSDQDLRKELDIKDPIKSFEELINSKMTEKNMSREQAISDILNTASKTRKSINEELLGK